MRNLRNLFLPVCKALTLGTRDDALAVSKRSGLKPMGYYMEALRPAHSDTCQDTTSQADVKPMYDPASASRLGSFEAEGYGMRVLCGTHSEISQDMTSGCDVNPSYDAVPVSKGSSFEPEEDMGLFGDTGSETQQGLMTSGLDVKRRYDAGAERVTGSCFFCGEEGHWAKNCPAKNAHPDPCIFNCANTPVQLQVQEKMCPCGAGVCKVLTANTKKNAGRKFYKCALEKDKGQCDFFQWCDTSHAHGDTRAEYFCPCGAGACIRLTAKTEKNMGREFYVCPLRQTEQSCRFFAWCDELSHDANRQTSKSGMDGGWAEDCSFPETMPSGQDLSRVVVNTCYKCGQRGHWFRDCPNRQFSNGSKGAAGVFNNHGEDTRGFREASIYGSPWSDEDVGAVRSADRSSCFKCGFPGHWAKDCPDARGCL